jgi:hypothetical protein
MLKSDAAVVRRSLRCKDDSGRHGHPRVGWLESNAVANTDERPPWYQRAFQLFAHEHFDSDNAAMLARSEWQQQQLRRALDANEPERPIQRAECHGGNRD